MVKPISQDRVRKQAFANYVVEQMSGFGPVQVKAMFGGFGLYAQGLMFALIVDDQLYFKADAQSLSYFAARDLAPFTYEAKGRRTSLKYYQAPAEAYDEPEQMCRWTRLAFDCAVRQRKAA